MQVRLLSGRPIQPRQSSCGRAARLGRGGASSEHAIQSIIVVSPTRDVSDSSPGEAANMARDPGGQGTVCKTGQAGSTPALASNACALDQWKVSSLRNRPCWFEPGRALQKFGWLAERKGSAVLRRRNRQVAQVRVLHHPPRYSSAVERRPHKSCLSAVRSCLSGPRITAAPFLESRSSFNVELTFDAGTGPAFQFS